MNETKSGSCQDPKKGSPPATSCSALNTKQMRFSTPAGTAGACQFIGSSVNSQLLGVETKVVLPVTVSVGLAGLSFCTFQTAPGAAVALMESYCTSWLKFVPVPVIVMSDGSNVIVPVPAA